MAPTRNVRAERLDALVGAIFTAAGASAAEARDVSEHLVESNLVGHDSHGVIRVNAYVRWIRDGLVFVGREPDVVLDEGPLAILDGRLGLGQTIAIRAIDLAITKSAEHGVAVVALRNSGHVGRLGHWAERAVRAGRIALCFVNTSGFGILQAPFGGSDRRISANPLAIGVPRSPGPDFILDISTSAIAEGKVQVALHRGEQVPEGTILDGAGRPTTDPERFYADPPGSLLPFGAHKGYGLALAIDILAGALSGGSCSRRGVPRLEQGLLSILIDPARFQPHSAFTHEIARFLEFVKESPPLVPGGEILVPGEVESRTRAARIAGGIPLDARTWIEILEAAASVGIDAATAERLLAPPRAEDRR